MTVLADLVEGTIESTPKARPTPPHCSMPAPVSRTSCSSAGTPSTTATPATHTTVSDLPWPLQTAGTSSPSVMPMLRASAEKPPRAPTATLPSPMTLGMDLGGRPLSAALDQAALGVEPWCHGVATTRPFPFREPA